MPRRAAHLGPGSLARDARAFLGLPTVEKAFVAGAFTLAPWASLAVRHVELRAILRGLSRLPLVKGAGSGLRVERGESLVRRAFGTTSEDARCLPESIVQYVLHLRVGPAPKLVVGVRRAETDPPVEGSSWELAAHAWIEEDDGPRRALAFSPILELSSTRGLGRAA